jgi:hypothetical protein
MTTASSLHSALVAERRLAVLADSISSAERLTRALRPYVRQRGAEVVVPPGTKIAPLRRWRCATRRLRNGYVRARFTREAQS